MLDIILTLHMKDVCTISLFRKNMLFVGFVCLLIVFVVLLLLFYCWVFLPLIKTWNYIGQNIGGMWGQANVNISTRQISFSKSLISLTTLTISEEHWLDKSVEFLFNKPNFFSGYAQVLLVLTCYWYLVFL